MSAYQMKTLNTFNVLYEYLCVFIVCYVISVKILSLYMRTTQQVSVVNVVWVDDARIFIVENNRRTHHAMNVGSALNSTPSDKPTENRP